MAWYGPPKVGGGRAIMHLHTHKPIVSLPTTEEEVYHEGDMLASNTGDANLVMPLIVLGE